MGYRYRLKSSDGSVSVEAALAISAFLVVAVIVVQSLVIGLWHVRARGVLAEAVRIATASGEPAKQVQVARSFISEQLPEAEVQQQLSDEGVRFELSQSLDIAVLNWRPAISVSESGIWQDAWVG